MLCVLAAVVLGAVELSGRNVPGWIVLLLALVTGIVLRIDATSFTGSDTVNVTNESLGLLARGLNPYAHLMMTSRPVTGTLFPYLPGELALYAIQKAVLGSLAADDRWWSVLVLLLFAALAPVVGSARAALALALYGPCNVAVQLGVDGSNDTGLFFLVLLAVALALYALRGHPSVLMLGASAAVFGWALAFKEFAWFAFPFFVRWLPAQRRWTYVAIAGIVACAFAGPFLAWDPAAFVRSIASGQARHLDVWGFNVWTMLAAYWPAQLVWNLSRFSEFVDLALVLATGFFMWPRAETTLGAALARSAVVFTVALLFARWTSVAYYGYLFAILALAIATSSTKSSQPPVPAPPVPQS